MSEDNNNDLFDVNKKSLNHQQPQLVSPSPINTADNPQVNSINKKVIGITCVIIGVILLILLISCLSHQDDLKYTTKSLSYTGNIVSAVVEVENNTNDYASYTLDLQVYDRYGDWVGYQYMKIKLDPHTKEEFEIVALCSTWDLEGSKAKVRVY